MLISLRSTIIMTRPQQGVASKLRLGEPSASPCCNHLLSRNYSHRGLSPSYRTACSSPRTPTTPSCLHDGMDGTKNDAQIPVGRGERHANSSTERGTRLRGIPPFTFSPCNSRATGKYFAYRVPVDSGNIVAPGGGRGREGRVLDFRNINSRGMQRTLLRHSS